ncbi:VOC family protein [Aciditerrimonas ferrireducens]|jgi:catechol 2,3-dioxygenase-like lactoylglutathione lyase family enzyme|uniref:VOC family protein n=1 Tax=Aciditerrimonas ferrireducens TaxID=667306 RepID=A0ABV6C0Z9_9ACTN
MSIRLATAFVPVLDPEASLAFYRDLLGLELRQDVQAGPHRWLTLAAPGQDAELVLFPPHGGRSEADGEALAALVAKGALQAAIFRTDDLEGTVARLRAAGVEVLEEPADRPWGVRDGAVRDPSGNVVRLAQA